MRKIKYVVEELITLKDGKEFENETEFTPGEFGSLREAGDAAFDFWRERLKGYDKEYLAHQEDSEHQSWDFKLRLDEDDEQYYLIGGDEEEEHKAKLAQAWILERDEPEE